jgi:hypothetical protein
MKDIDIIVQKDNDQILLVIGEKKNYFNIKCVSIALGNIIEKPNGNKKP